MTSLEQQRNHLARLQSIAALLVIYGTTSTGGYHGQHCPDRGCGVVFRLRPPATTPPSPFIPWTETTLYAFAGLPNDGYQPYGTLTFDSAGNLYGTTFLGGVGLFGTVFKLTPANGGWTEDILYGFDYGNDGMQLESGVTTDQAGNFYGTTETGGSLGYGVIYELSPTQSGWQQTVLHTFALSDGANPVSSLVMDQAGNLYGSTPTGGANDGGVVYELSPSNGGWTYKVLYSFADDGVGPTGPLAMDAAGNLYGCTFNDGANGVGMVFKLSQNNGNWTLTDLHDFSFDTTSLPAGGVTLDAAGNLYGTTTQGGGGPGVVWEITP